MNILSLVYKFNELLKQKAKLILQAVTVAFFALCAMPSLAVDLPPVPPPPPPPTLGSIGGNAGGPATEATQLKINALLEWIAEYHEERQYDHLININRRLLDQLDYMSVEELEVFRRNLVKHGQSVSVELVNGVLTPVIKNEFFNPETYKSNLNFELTTLENQVTGKHREAYDASVIQNKVDNYKTLEEARKQSLLKELEKPDEFYKYYESWSKGAIESVGQAAHLAGLHNERMQKEEHELMEALHGLNRNPVGRNQILQTSAMTQLETSKQLQKLRHLVGAQTNAEASYYAMQASEEAAAEALSEQFFKRDVLDQYNQETYAGNKKLKSY